MPARYAFTPLLAAGVCLLVLAGCGQEASAPPAPVSPPPTFTTTPVSDLAIHPERSAPAAVIGQNEARISAEVSAAILALPVDVGERVRRGGLIARLDPRDAELALERAEAALAQARAREAQAQAQWARARALREKNFISTEALSLRETEQAAAAADLRAALAQRDTARRFLEKHRLTAPFDAVVRARSGQVGELAAPGTVLLTLVSDGDVTLAVQLQVADSAWVPLASPLRFEHAGEMHPLRLLRISPTVHRAARSVEARFAFVETPLPAGSEGRLVWRDPRPHLPTDLLVRRDGHLGVFVAEGGRARFHGLSEAAEGRPAAIDLPGEARIVVQGRHALQDGDALP